MRGIKSSQLRPKIQSRDEILVYEVDASAPL